MPTEVEILRREVAAQLVWLAKHETRKALVEAENEVRHRKRMEIFGRVFKSGPAGREIALQAVLTDEERAFAKQLREMGRATQGLRLPWLHRGARILR